MVQSKTELFEKELSELAGVFKVLAHPARLQILQFLAETKTCMSGDISEELPLGRTTVNQHLKELKVLGLIQGHVEGVKTNYCLDYKKIEEMKVHLIGFLNEFQTPEDFLLQINNKKIQVMKVLILCTGNSCRSQMAHGFLHSFDNRLEVASAGTEASGKLNQKAVEVMKEAGVDISQHTSDPVDKYLGEEWDYVITVCGGANESCPAFFGKVKHRMHIGFDDPSHAIGTPEFIQSEYYRVREEIREGFLKFYNDNLKNKLI